MAQPSFSPGRVGNVYSGSVWFRYGFFWRLATLAPPPVTPISPCGPEGAIGRHGLPSVPEGSKVEQAQDAGLQAGATSRATATTTIPHCSCLGVAGPLLTMPSENFLLSGFKSSP
jgi:hypothetical protein